MLIIRDTKRAKRNLNVYLSIFKKKLLTGDQLEQSTEDPSICFYDLSFLNQRHSKINATLSTSHVLFKIAPISPFSGPLQVFSLLLSFHSTDPLQDEFGDTWSKCPFVEVPDDNLGECGKQAAFSCRLILGLPQLQRAISSSSHLSQRSSQLVSERSRDTKAPDISAQSGTTLFVPINPRGLSRWGSLRLCQAYLELDFTPLPNSYFSPFLPWL